MNNSKVAVDTTNLLHHQSVSLKEDHNPRLLSLKPMHARTNDHPAVLPS
ncbi:MAG: hypothetical protein DDT37_01782 [Firmicutes bacterium]|nr:hypothetical protein [candidate division NPL-UPA2 bacterium]